MVAGYYGCDMCLLEEGKLRVTVREIVSSNVRHKYWQCAKTVKKIEKLEKLLNVCFKHRLQISPTPKFLFLSLDDHSSTRFQRVTSPSVLMNTQNLKKNSF